MLQTDIGLFECDIAFAVTGRPKSQNEGVIHPCFLPENCGVAPQGSSSMKVTLVMDASVLTLHFAGDQRVGRYFKAVDERLTTGLVAEANLAEY